MVATCTYPKLQSFFMDPSISRLKLRLVWAGYAVVAAVSALLVFVRYLRYVENPQDVAAAGGMYAGGDLLLEIIICLLFLVPTAALVLVIRKSDAAYATYAKVLLALSVTAPLSAILLAVPFFNQWQWGEFVLLASLLLTRSSRARRLTHTHRKRIRLHRVDTRLPLIDSWRSPYSSDEVIPYETLAPSPAAGVVVPGADAEKTN